MSSGAVDITPGYLFNEDDSGETLTYAKLNKMPAEAILRIQAGAVTARELADGSITADKLDAAIEAQLGLADGSVTSSKLADDSVGSQHIQDGAVLPQHLSSSIEFVPTGAIIEFPRSTVPSGFLHCNGASVAKADYPDLYAFLCDGGSACIYGETAANFTLPDYRGMFRRGWDAGAGNDKHVTARTDRGDGETGDKVGTYQMDYYREHKHDIQLRAAGTGGTYPARSAESGTVILGDLRCRPDRGDIHSGEEVIPANKSVLVCIKT
jgi:hypothetical protein